MAELQRFHQATIAALLLAASALGCASHAARVRDARSAFFAGHLDQTAALLDQAGRGRENERDCLLLDQAMVALVRGQPLEAERKLRTVRDRFDALEQTDLAEEGISLLSDDTQRAYAGEDYEKVLIRVFLAIANLMHDGQDATAYCLQVEQKQRAIVEQGIAGVEENPKLAYKRVAIGAYLHGVLQEATHQNYDGAERAFTAVASWEPNFSLARFDVERVRNGVHSARGNGVVYVMTLVGRGPYKEQVAAPATSTALLAADRFLSAVGDHSLPPTVAAVKIPGIVVPYNAISSVAVLADERPVGLTQTVTDIGELALRQHEATLPYVIARAVVRRAIKKAAVYTTKDALRVGNGLTNLAFDAAGVIWEASESADTRCWGLLPARIQVLRVELPVGEHTLTLRPTGLAGPIGRAHSITVHVEDGRNTYVLACFPGGHLVGEILTSDSQQ